MSGFANLKDLLEAAQRIQVEMTRVKAELGARTVTGEAGGGLVSCVANGRGELVSLAVDASLIGPDGKKMLEDLVVAAVNQALERARELAQKEVVEAAGGLGLPPGALGG
jgi:hypothetical protein